MKTLPRLTASRRRTLHDLLRGTAATALCALATTLVHSLPTSPQEHVGINAERGDPVRWSVAADTPQLKYDAEAKGVRAALGEDLKACRALQSDRTGCEAQARAQFRRDMDDARGLLMNSREKGALRR